MFRNRPMSEQYNIEHDLSLFPCYSFRHSSQHDRVMGVVEFNDGTLYSCSSEGTINRWTFDGKLLNVFRGHKSSAMCVMDMDDNSFLSASADATMKVWNKTTSQCVETIPTTIFVSCLLRLRNKISNNTFLAGMFNGRIEERRVEDFKTLYILKQHIGIIKTMCELSNGNVVSGSEDCMLKEWDMTWKAVIRIFSGHWASITKVIQLKDNIIASASSDSTVRIWDKETTKCLSILNGHTSSVAGIVQLSDGTLLSGSYDQTIREWNIKGECVSTSHLGHGIAILNEMSDGSIVIGGRSEIEVRKTWISRQALLIDLCCKVIARHHTELDMVALEQELPQELHEQIVKYVRAISSKKLSSSRGTKTV
eukprot:TRINITY_DN5024_c0_g1_i1.p1 TRINITY_DN5024_c0_g1~~TRINITY_DN5024_c0_g1_i1.p1  ORF type:complete len:366 (+),score=48.90 TRINITY_DN5024_c0_g1_i1:18-1115(+)